MTSLKIPVMQPIYEIRNNARSAEQVWILLERHLNVTATESDTCCVEELALDMCTAHSSKASNSGFHLLKVGLQPGEKKLACILSF